MPVSAADEPATMLYNGVELPNIDTVWTDKSVYSCGWIMLDSSNGLYYLNVLKLPVRVELGNYVTDDNYRCTFIIDNGEWKLTTSDMWISGILWSTSAYLSVWSNFNILNEDGTIYLAASEPVNPNAPTPITGTLAFLSQQVLDDSASLILQAYELSDPTAEFSYAYKLYSGGEELRSVVVDDIETGKDSYLIHTTLAALDPETEYEITYTLYANGEPTEITATTTFTTQAASGSGEGESGTIDYTGQLNDIQQGVDEVGTKLDGVQDTLTETKEEITSLPGKIASAILDGIKSLFVPSEEDLTEIKDKYESMLSEKLGFIWQAFDLLTTFVSDLQTSLESGEAYEFNFPGVKLPMQGEEFVLVPETPVSLDNELMDVLRPVVGTIVSMIAVIAFVNMAHDYVLAIVSGVSAYQFERRKE